MKYLLITISIIFCFIEANATHNRAGEFRIEQVGDLTIRVTLVTYTKTSSQQADRDSLIFYWGDGTFEDVLRSNGDGQPLDNDVKFNTYVAEHTYPGRATYTIGVFDKNRVGNILNVNPPNSIGIPFYVEATYSFLNPQFQGSNNTVILLQPPIDFACVGQRFVHNPNAVDSTDNDSIAFELIVPLADSGLQVPKYSFPDQIVPGPFNRVTLDPITGEFVWDAPQAVGEYNIAILVKEYRNGALISSIIRDMQILVINCDDNEPPELDLIEEICVIAGETIELDIGIDDPNEFDRVKISALGGPLITNINPAVLIAPLGFQNVPATSKFVWNTACEHISDQYYSVVFRAVDNFLDTTGLATLKTLRIKVIGPPPEEVITESDASTIRISWQKPYNCEEVEKDYFKGFSVWRRESPNQFDPDSCTTGLSGRGYEKIAFNLNDFDVNGYFYVDFDVQRGKTYCYRILGEFAKTALSGLSFNRVESVPSNESCIQLSRDVPLITKVSVDETDMQNGIMSIRWAKPLADQLDTIENPGPYRFRLMFGDDFMPATYQPVPGADFSNLTFQDFVDTSFIHQDIDTRSTPYSYRVDFFTGSQSDAYGNSLEASSIYLTTTGTDETNILTWASETPWDNFEFEVYRLNEQNDFELIARTSEPMYRDENLLNGTEYCYYVRGFGTYGIEDIEDPLINDSQESCSIPMDDIPPCPPDIEVENICDLMGPDVPMDIFNTVVWRYPPDACFEWQDVALFNIYYAPSLDAEFELIGSVNAIGSQFNFDHQPERGIAGCYVVTAIDEIGNESGFSNTICVENCPFYELPNVFTPNNDGSNDVFRPFPYRFIDRVEFKVFNRWGNLVFQTTDPDINWTGNNLTGQQLSDGVYHYVCKVFEAQDSGTNQPTVLKGFIELLSGGN